MFRFCLRPPVVSDSGTICRAPNETKAHDGKVGKGAQACMSVRWMGVKSPCLQLIINTNSIPDTLMSVSLLKNKYEKYRNSGQRKEKEIFKNIKKRGGGKKANILGCIFRLL